MRFRLRLRRQLSLLLLCWACNGVAQQARLLIQSSPLAGFQYHAGVEVWDQLRVGDRLALIHEPANRHDRNAIRIEWQGRQIGYLPRAENQLIALELARGSRVEARIARLQETQNPWQRILIDVYIGI
jgi:hypothetical protein